MRMKIKCIALDLDRTTLNSDGYLSQANRDALEAAIDAGIHIVVASGRSLDSLPEDIFQYRGSDMQLRPTVRRFMISGRESV